MFIFVISGKSSPCMQVNFSRSWRELVNLKAHATTCLPEGEICAIFGRNLGQLPRGIAQFLGGAVDRCLEFHNLWVDLSYRARFRSFHWEYCLTRLHSFWVQQAVNQICTISWGKTGSPLEFHNFLRELLSQQLNQVRRSGLWGEWSKLSHTSWQAARKPVKLVYFTVQDMLLRMVGREAPYKAKEKFWRVVVATTT